MRKISLSKKDKRINPKVQLVLIVLAFVLLSIGIAVIVLFQTYHVYEKNTVKATCEANGYTESVCVICKKIERTHYTSALGHIYGEVKLKYKPTELDFGENYQQCSRCKKQKIIKTEPTIDFKKLYFSGDAFYVDANRVAAGSITYSYKGKKTTYYVSLGYADDDNSRYIKHDYNISFFADKKHTKQVEVALMNGKPAAHTWRLYGNYYDFNNVRDTVVTELFRDVRKSSKLIDKRLSDNFLTSKQEPVLFFMNSSFVGVFRLLEIDGPQTLNVKETDKMCAIVRASYSSAQSYFKSEITDGGPWRVRYNYTDDDAWIYESLNELATFVIENDGEDFKKGISKYLDVDGMIDYMLVIYNTAAADNVARSLTLGTYDGKVWTPGFFDADASFGLNNQGEITLLETVLAPYYKTEENLVVMPDTNSLLFDRMFNCFYDEIKKRYKTLKSTVFTAKNIYEKFQKHINLLPQTVYEKEKEKYPIVDSEIDLKQFLNEFMTIRKDNLNSFFEAEKKSEPVQETSKTTAQ